MTDDHSITVDALRAELVRERARADSFEAINRVQAASLAELAARAGELPISEMGDRRGYARGWHRGPQWITLWFTGPTALAYGDSSDHGRLTSVDAIRAVITSARSLSASALAEWVTARQEAHTVPFDAPYVRVFAHLQAGP